MGRAHDPVTARDAGGSFKPCGYQLLVLPLRRTPQLAVEVEGGAYEGEAILELRDGKVWRDTRYFAEPFEAPEWRAQWVERMKP
jgi:hypothetical protein